MIKIILLILMIPSISQADYTESFYKAKEKNRSLIVVFQANWCKPCQIMKQETWNDQEFIESLAKYYDICFVNIDEEQELWEQYKNEFPSSNLTIPAHAIINIAKHKTRLRKGYINQQDMVDWINKR